MSTYFYVTCLDHNPIIQAENESGQHRYDLPQIREDIANRDLLVAAYNEAGMWPDGDYFRSNTIWFLIQHPRCRLGIRDENGKDYVFTEEGGGDA